MDITIEEHVGSHREVAWSFREAEDSEELLERYIDLGRVWVAVDPAGRTIGHLQAVPRDDTWEVTNTAVLESERGGGIGRALLERAVEEARSVGVRRVVLATATADIGNLRFYQRQGFRMRSVERDAFTPATGYPPGLLIDGIELRDRVWLDRVVLGEWTIFQVRMRV
jgi:GNAT superfamily N-acetyltransferase